jgi:hypothetical protein
MRARQKKGEQYYKRKNDFTIRANRCDDSTRSRQLAIRWTSRLPTQDISAITYSFFFFAQSNACGSICCITAIHDRVATDCCYSPFFFAWMDNRDSWNSPISQSLLLMSRSRMNKCLDLSRNMKLVGNVMKVKSYSMLEFSLTSRKVFLKFVT